MRTTIDINDATLRELKARARERKCSLREMVAETLSLGLTQQSKGEKKKRFKVKPHNLGLKAEFRGVSLNQLYDQLEAEDTARST